MSQFLQSFQVFNTGPLKPLFGLLMDVNQKAAAVKQYFYLDYFFDSDFFCANHKKEKATTQGRAQLALTVRQMKE